jgi:serum/glucocorticoid-regulated kinase 1/serum/glucocorticoid-regulated kinase 2
MKEMLKSLIISKKSVISILFERELLSRISNPFICNMCYAFQDSENLYLVSEFSAGGDLRYHLYKNKVFNEKEASKYNFQNK